MASVMRIVITNNWSGRTTQYWWRTRKPDFDEFEIS
jgi:hypothetical protein